MPEETLLSVEEYLAADEEAEDARLEYVAGHVYALTGATRRHATISMNVGAFFHAAARETDCHVYQSELRLRVARDLRFYPDVMVVCGGDEGADPREESAPTILVEILSDSTAHRDVGIKLAAYRQIPSLKQYLIIAQDKRRVEVHSRGHSENAWSHQVVTGTDVIPVPQLDTALPLDIIYARLPT